MTREQALPYVSYCVDDTTNWSNDMIKGALALLVEQVGARRAAENFVELMHDNGQERKGRDPAETATWRAVARKLGNTVHCSNMEWPS